MDTIDIEIPHSKFKDEHNGSLYPVYGRLLEVQYDIPAVTFY